MAEDPDPERLRQLEERIERARKPEAQRSAAVRGFGQGEVAWRMVIELATGMGLGLAIGFGLDTVFGTKPVMIVIFSLLGFAAGVKTMLGTAAGLAGKRSGDSPKDEEGT